MPTEAALPAVAPATEASAQPTAEQLALTAANKAIDENANDGELTSEQQAAAKKEKTPEQREIDRLRRGIDRKHRQLAEARAQLGLTRQQEQTNNHAPADDSEPLSLTRAELAEMVKAEAQKLAPAVSEQAAEFERRQGVVQGLSEKWGKEKFDELASDLDDSFGGLKDSKGNPKPAIEAVFECKNPAGVIEYLADPEHSEEADKIARMSGARAGLAIAEILSKLAPVIPPASQAAKPLEPTRGAGPAKKTLADLSGAEYDKRRREQIANRHR